TRCRSLASTTGMPRRLSRRSETATAGGFHADQVEGSQVACGFRRHLLAVHEVAPGGAILSAAGSRGPMSAALGDDGQAARLEHAKLPDDTVAPSVESRAAGAEPQLVAFDPQRIRELEGLGRSGQCV